MKTWTRLVALLLMFVFAIAITKVFVKQMDIEYRQYRPIDKIMVVNEDQCSRLPRPWFSHKPLPIVALFGPPGSGNTWLRYLIESATGTVTGSRYCDHWLTDTFLGECHGFTHDTIGTKTHNPITDPRIEKVIVMLRRPERAWLSDFKRFASNGSHTGNPDIRRKKITEFRVALLSDVVCWANSVLRTLAFYPGPLLVVHYDNLRYNISREISQIVRFLGAPHNPTRLACTILSSRGSFQRNHTIVDNFEAAAKLPEVRKRLDEAYRDVGEAAVIRGCSGGVSCGLKRRSQKQLQGIFQKYNTTQSMKCPFYTPQAVRRCGCFGRLKQYCLCHDEMPK